MQGQLRTIATRTAVSWPHGGKGWQHSLLAGTVPRMCAYARSIFYDARVALARPEAFPGDSRAVEFADMALRNAENLLDLVAAQERTAGPD